jgi:hypothetical protein
VHEARTGAAVGAEPQTHVLASMDVLAPPERHGAGLKHHVVPVLRNELGGLLADELQERLRPLAEHRLRLTVNPGELLRVYLNECLCQFWCPPLNQQRWQLSRPVVQGASRMPSAIAVRRI